mgnify:CR=1 FL=1
MRSARKNDTVSSNFISCQKKTRDEQVDANHQNNQLPQRKERASTPERHRILYPIMKVMDGQSKYNPYKYI